MVLIFLRALDRLQITIFNCIIKRDFIANQNDYAAQLVAQTRVLMKIMQKIRRYFPDQERLMSRLESMYELIFSLDLLKHRLFDHATFEVCENELKNIKVSISEKIAEVSMFIRSRVMPRAISVRDKPFHWDEKAIASVQAFEALFQVTLQFITSDPMIFIFFIRNVKALHEELINLSVDLQSLQNEIQA